MIDDDDDDDDDECGAVDGTISRPNQKSNITSHGLEPGPKRWEASC
jgi:hypothetical protein